MEQKDLPELYPGWKTVRKIGSGSFGTVYEIERNLFGTVEKAALKYITIPQSDADVEDMYSCGYDDASITAHFQTYLANIAREYSLMAEMKGHTNVVYCDDIRYTPRSDGVGWNITIKMELLTPLLKSLGPDFGEEKVVRLGKDLCRALVLCKDRDIIHRDIKPQNIFVSKSGDYKLGDFGIAKNVEQTVSGTKIGTYNYMAPEVYHSQPYGSSADIYSLGLVMYWLLNERRLPFLAMPPASPSYQEYEVARHRRFLGEQLPAPKNGSEALKAIVLKACAFEPKDRFASAGEMLEALENLGKKQTAAPAEDGTVPVRHGAALETTVPVNREPETSPATEAEDCTVSIRSHKVPEPENGTVTVKSRQREAEQPPRSGTAQKRHDSEGMAHEKKETGSRGKVVIGLLTFIILVIGLILAYESFIAPSSLSVPKEGAISAGHNYAVYLRPDGTVAATGNNDYGQCEVSRWRDIVAVSAGWYHTVGLRSDGTVVIAGEKGYGSGASAWTDIVAVSAGLSHTVGLQRDGTVVAVGSNDYGQCDVSEWTDIVAVAAGNLHTVGMKKDGTVVAVGDTSQNRCDVSEWSNIENVSVGVNNTVGLQRDGTVIATRIPQLTGVYNQIRDWTNIVAVSGGGYNTTGLKRNGTVVTVGNLDVSAWTDIVAISAADTYIMGLKSDGTIVVAGKDSYGRRIDADELR